MNPNLDPTEVLDMLARIVNRASHPKKTSAEAIQVVQVNLALIEQAREVLRKHRAGGDVSAEVEIACERCL